MILFCSFVCLFVFFKEWSSLGWRAELDWTGKTKMRYVWPDQYSSCRIFAQNSYTYSLRLLCNLICCFSFLNFRCNIKVRYCSRYDLAWCRLIDFFFFKSIWASARELFLLVDGGVIIDPRPFAFLTAREGSSRCLSCEKEKSFGVENDGGVANNQTPPL